MLIRSLKINTLLILVLALVLSGCGVVETFSETLVLRNDILEHYGDTGSIGVQYSVSTGIGKSIRIEWENSDAFSLDDPEIEKKTEELANFVYDHYEGIDKVNKIQIVLIESQNFVIFNTGNTTRFIYDVDEFAHTGDDA